jgi:hypothetical protein
VKRSAKTVALSWPAVRDGGGLRGYRVKIGTRILTVSKPTATIARAKILGAVSISAVDRAGNAGPAIVVSRSRLR